MAVRFGDSIVTKGLVLYLNASSQKNYVLSEVEALVVAGGGAGGNGTATGYESGGGGAGGLIYSSSYPIAPGSAITVTIGNGGATAVSSSNGANGQNSVFDTLVAIGGGGGASSPAGGSGGGSGGGGSHAGTARGSGTAGQGFSGATPAQGSSGGGGGGAGEPGKSTLSNADGSGGIGLPFSISGSLQYYAGGGGGSRHTNVSGGLGGGGAGVSLSAGYANGSSALPNTGGGGGGANQPATNTGGGAGGSGVVIVRYPGPQKATGGNTIVTIGGYTIHTFTSSGTFTPLAVPSNAGAVYGLQDLSGNNNTGTQSGGVTYNTANGGSLVFDGSNDYITSTFFTTSGQAVTYIGWLYSTETTSIYKNFVDSVTARPMIWWNTSGQIEFDAAFYTTPAVYRNQWVYVALSKPSGSSSASYYVNGVLVGTGGGYTTPALTPTWFNRAAAQTWKGNSSYVQAYNRALTATEILQNFNAQRGRFGI